MCEKDPSGKSPNEPGAKLDHGKNKAGGLALLAVSEVGTFGANKYSRGGWRSVENGTDAMWRHLLKEQHEPVDKDSNLDHAAHMAWNALARLELIIAQPEKS